MVREWEQGNCAEINYFTEKRAAREMEEAEKNSSKSHRRARSEKLPRDRFERGGGGGGRRRRKT